MALLRAEQPRQAYPERLHVGEGADQSQGLILTLEQFEALCGARDKEALLFIAVPGGLDENEAITVIIVARLDVPILPR